MAIITYVSFFTVTKNYVISQIKHDLKEVLGTPAHGKNPHRCRHSHCNMGFPNQVFLQEHMYHVHNEGSKTQLEKPSQDVSPNLKNTKTQADKSVPIIGKFYFKMISTYISMYLLRSILL